MSHRVPDDDSSASFEALRTRLEAGDEDAADALFRLYARRLVGLARSRMSARLQQKVDPEDVVQSVFRSFFVRNRDGAFELTGWDGLWGLLARITLRKCSRKLARYTTAARDLAAEAPQAAEGSVGSGWEAVARDPTADEAAELAEVLELLLMQAEDDTTREVLVLRLQGHSVSEIADAVARTERSVQRKLSRVREKLERLIDAD